MREERGLSIDALHRMHPNFGGEARLWAEDDDVRLWAEFRAALCELGQADPERARNYLRGATASLHVWTRGLPTQAAAPRQRLERDCGGDR